ncbi:unnamed protein product [Aureobasidium uvarum]|uniref:Uncharacterized protein n=1 Tax=Aureobasidium uvarum TaxID=2773716 RepID=A0A9N8KKK1_9PEZI|nr:unnamed protein product [Aureobasidium uvarum]
MSGFSINGVYPEFKGETPYMPEDFADQYPNDPEKQRQAADRKNQVMAQEKQKKSSSSFAQTAKGLFKRKSQGGSEDVELVTGQTK